MTGFLRVFALALGWLPTLAAAAPAAQTTSPPPASGCADGPDMRQLSTVVNSRDSTFQCLGIVLAGATITGVRFEKHDGGDVKVVFFPVAVIESAHGAVLDGTPGHDAIILRGAFDRRSSAARLEISYLYNGLTSEYRQCAVSIEQSALGEWRLFNTRHEAVPRIDIETRNVPVIGTIGIATLAGACVGS